MSVATLTRERFRIAWANHCLLCLFDPFHGKSVPDFVDKRPIPDADLQRAKEFVREKGWVTPEHEEPAA